MDQISVILLSKLTSHSLRTTSTISRTTGDLRKATLSRFRAVVLTLIILKAYRFHRRGRVVMGQAENEFHLPQEQCRRREYSSTTKCLNLVKA